MKRLLIVFAHPDDESLFAGAMARYARQGVRVSLACATKGEAGEISDPSLATPANLGTMREAELRCACDQIGISDLHLLGYCDSGMDGTLENDRTTAFIQADPDEIRSKLVALMRDLRPHVVITFEPKGWYGHPDHIAAGRYTTEAYYLAADPAAFPAAGPPWRPDRLFHAVILRSSFKPMVDYAREQGQDTSNFDEMSFDEPEPLAAKITHTLDVSDLFELKKAAMLCHQTQFGDDNLLLQAPPEVQLILMGQENYIQVDPPREQTASPATDLFTG
jgi:LmbE family N-acetylglucosaminyl deacetylase